MHITTPRSTSEQRAFFTGWDLWERGTSRDATANYFRTTPNLRARCLAGWDAADAQYSADLDLADMDAD